MVLGKIDFTIFTDSLFELSDDRGYEGERKEVI